MCLSNEEVISIRALEDTLKETVELAQTLYDSVKPPMNSNGITETPELKAALRPSQIPAFIEPQVANIKA
jgi:hypothetical protein